MPSERKPIRVLYSFPHKIGAGRICNTAWQQVNGLAAAGASVLAFPGVVHRPFPASVRAQPTLARGKWRIPYKVLGTIRACALHDYIVSRRLEKLAGQVDIVHLWPLGSERTLKTAAKLGIATVLERPNSHTRFAYEVVQKECDRLGVALPRNHEHAYNARTLAIEEEEYRLTDTLLCPSEFVVRTFLDEGFSPEKLARHLYGFDEEQFYPSREPQTPREFTVLFVGVCAVRKGLHFALEAWLQSSAHRDGCFLIAGDFVPEYRKKLAPLLSHPSVKVLGHRSDVPELMRKSDVLVLPTIEEGFPLACAEALGSGCVPLVSEVCQGICRHMANSLVHPVGDVKTLAQHMTLVHDDRALLAQLRSTAQDTKHEFTWSAAGVRLLEVYREAVAMKQSRRLVDRASSKP